MKPKLLILIFILPFFISSQSVKYFRMSDKSVEIILPDGILKIYPLAENAIRVKLYDTKEKDVLPELVFQSTNSIPKYKVKESASKIEVVCKNIRAIVDKKTGNLEFIKAGKVILKEKIGSRIFKRDSIRDEPCFFVEQTFNSPEDEYIFGLGQYQDGHYNIRGITRRLIQVNSQISIPFIYSSKGYGLLWHQYGLTDFNPADNLVKLQKVEKNNEGEHWAEVTTTSGTQRILQNQSLYYGTFAVPEDGEYSIFLDLSNMDNRHYVVIDGQPVIDQSNIWLPPTVGTLVRLKAGEHEVQVVCKSDNTPTLSWKLKENTTTFRSPHAKMIDYVVFSGTADEVIATYRQLTGKAPLLPIWAYGFWQCRERYTSASHLIETVKEFRKREIPMDVIVQDWQYWGNRGWGVPQFDETQYPDPSGFIKELHNLNAHFCISIWSNPDKRSQIGNMYETKKLYIPETNWLDYFNPKTGKEYWNTLYDNMFVHGVDAWWMDATEPENDALKGRSTYMGLGEFYRLTYPLFVCQAVYEEQRKVTSEKRVCILTRSAFLGQQKYASINWSGDIGGDWDAYRRQIVAGLNYSITGLPYWTTDIGGFFRPGHLQYTDEKYHELLIRWFQWGVFNPIFRVHAYQTETEPWKYGEKVENLMRNIISLRYCLLPYIYSEAWQVTTNGSTMMRPLIMDFSTDKYAVEQAYEFMFGKSILVTPITEQGILKKKVYLPKGNDWFDFWTGEKFKGGQYIVKETPIDIMPLYVKAGTILPIGPKVQYATEKKWDTLEIRIYEGADGEFTLYEDEGNNYNYEKGAYSTITFKWNETKKTLTISERKGYFPGMLVNRNFHIVKVSAGKGIGYKKGKNIDKSLIYEGKETKVILF